MIEAACTLDFSQWTAMSAQADAWRDRERPYDKTASIVTTNKIEDNVQTKARKVEHSAE